MKLILFSSTQEHKKKGEGQAKLKPANLFYPPGSSPDVTGHTTVPRTIPSGSPESIEFTAQLVLVDSPLPTFFCFISCSVFVSDSSPPATAYADVENTPVSAAAIMTVAIANALFITNE